MNEFTLKAGINNQCKINNHVSLILPILYRFNRKWMWVGISPWSPRNTNHGLLGFFLFWRRSRIHNYGYSTFTHPMLYVKNTKSNVILWKNVEYSNQILLAKTLHYGSDILSWSSNCKIFSNMSKFIISDSRPKWSNDKYKFCPGYSKGPIIYFFDDRSPSFSNCLDGTFPWRNIAKHSL